MQRSASDNKRLLRKLEEQADELGRVASSDALPVSLKAVAQRRRVTSVEFAPLLVRAMLTTHAKGFRIFVKSEDEDEGARLQRLYEDEGDGSALPLKFRFSLAHELAHTLFYDLGAERPVEIREFRAGGGKTVLQNLERYCNKIAARLLLPTEPLSQAIRNLQFLHPKDLVTLANRAGASPEVLVIRLNDLESHLIDHDLRGCVAVVRKTSQGYFVKAIARPKNLNIAREIRAIQSGERWQIATPDGKAVFTDEVERHIDLPLTFETNLSRQEIRHHLRYYRYSHSDLEESYLVYLTARDAS
jgi:hypothetical protein